jgi:SNF2 family DNA or RNA helicase
VASVVCIMLINYKVGSEGLNLVEAKHIILCENWWTPVVQQQAKARSHRIGQDKKINIWTITVKNSIEEKIEDICNSKKILINSFLQSNQEKQKIKLDSYTLGRLLKK